MAIVGRPAHQCALIQTLRYQGMREALAWQRSALARQPAINRQLLQERGETGAALRAGRAHIEQLQRKVLLIQGALDDHRAGEAGRR